MLLSPHSLQLVLLTPLDTTLTFYMNKKMTSKHQKVTSRVIDSQTFQMSRHPAFVEAVNRAANLKIAEAIKSGKLRPVLRPNAPTPVRYAPRYVDQ